MSDHGFPGLRPGSDELVLETLRKDTAALLSKCTERQRELFSRMYPGGIDSLEERRLRNAHDQCRRTVIKNENSEDPERNIGPRVKIYGPVGAATAPGEIGSRGHGGSFPAKK